MTGAFNELYKPIEEWDLEELARGRPRDKNGNFRGATPHFITREIHERAMERFKTVVKSEVGALSGNALAAVQMVLLDDRVDDKGKPLISAASKMDAAKFIIEHAIGKPVQQSTSDISVRLQAVLGSVMVNPTELGTEYAMAHVGTRGELTGDIHDAEVVDDGDD